MCLYSYHGYFIFSDKSEKRATERNESLNLSSLLINWGTQFLILVDWIIENDMRQTLCVVPEFLSSGGGFDCFFQSNVLPKISKITVTCPKSLKWTSRVGFDLPKVSRMTINFKLLKVRKMTSLKNYYLKSWRS